MSSQLLWKWVYLLEMTHKWLSLSAARLQTCKRQARVMVFNHLHIGMIINYKAKKKKKSFIFNIKQILTFAICQGVFRIWNISQEWAINSLPWKYPMFVIFQKQYALCQGGYSSTRMCFLNINPMVVNFGINVMNVKSCTKWSLI